jgi:tripartite-type tricarboxylate transporter receptor subunit TctC
MISRRAAASAILAVATGAGFAQGTGYPGRPIRLVIPYAPGGGTDQLGRVLAEKLRPRLGQPIVVENKPGAGTLLATEYVAKQPPDGYTLLLTTPAIASAPATVAKLGFHPLNDLTHIAPLAVMLISLTASKDLPVSNVRELIAYMKAQPGKVNYASYGVSTSGAIAMAEFNHRAGTVATHVPYKVGGQALTEMMAGQVHVMLDSMQTSGPQIRSGKLKVLAVASAKRSAQWPDVPTISESGLPGFTYEPWFALSGPAGMPAAVVQRLNSEINAVLADADVQETMRVQYLTATPGTPAQITAHVTRELAYWTAAAKAAGVHPE